MYAPRTTSRFSPNHYIGRLGQHIRLVGVHTMEAQEAGNTAESVAAFFGNPALQASAHWCVDDNSRVRVVHDRDAAWTMPPVNQKSLNIEIAGFAAQNNRQWHDPYSLEALNIAALCAAEWVQKYRLPIRRLTSDEIAADARGFVGHRDINAVFHKSDHTDPGPDFPWDDFLDMVRVHVADLVGVAHSAG
jgi:N-acetyl-anhydromuramyl-L-alanine amidase AmpD